MLNIIDSIRYNFEWFTKTHRIQIIAERVDTRSLVIRCRARDVSVFDELDNRLDAHFMVSAPYEWSSSDIDALERTYTFYINTNEETHMKHNTNEIVLTEDFHVPGTDIVFEKGDKISIVSKQNEAYGDDYQKLLHGILDLVETYNLHRKYSGRDLDRIIMDAAEEASIKAMDL